MSFNLKNKQGIVPIIVILVVVIAASAIVFFVLRNIKGLASAANSEVSACSVDINGDGIVNKADLQAIAAQFGSKEGAPYDVNGDGSIDILDISAAAKLNGQTCEKNVAAASQSACSADVNRDGIVDRSDLNFVADQIGAKGGPADINGDGIVNILDISKVAGSIGQKCGSSVASVCSIADANRDGVIDSKDLQIMAGDFGRKSQYDLDGDGVLTIIDLSKAANAIGQTCAKGTSVPAPQSVNPTSTPTSGGSTAANNTTPSTVNPTPVPTPDDRIANNCNGADVDRDGAVTILDLQLVQKDYGKASKYDVDGDGIISIIDISRVNANYGKKCKP